MLSAHSVRRQVRVNPSRASRHLQSNAICLCVHCISASSLCSDLFLQPVGLLGGRLQLCLLGVRREDDLGVGSGGDDGLRDAHALFHDHGQGSSLATLGKASGDAGAACGVVDHRGAVGHGAGACDLSGGAGGPHLSQRQGHFAAGARGGGGLLLTASAEEGAGAAEDGLGGQFGGGAVRAGL